MNRNSIRLIVALSLFLFVMLGCSRNAEELGAERSAHAARNDLHARCRMMVQEENFAQQHEQCKIFSEKDRECAHFPEQKVGCNQFLRAPDYLQQRFSCEVLMTTDHSCHALMMDSVPGWRRIENARLRNLLGSGFGMTQFGNWVEWVSSASSPAINIGVIYEVHSDAGNDGPARRFLQGLEMALQEINEGGGIQGREVRLHYAPTDGSIVDARRVAERLQRDTSIVSVIGFQSSATSTLAAVLYERSNMVYLITAAVKNDVVRHGMRMVFRLIPPQDDITREMVRFAQQQELTNIALLYSRDATNEELAYSLRDQALQHRLRIVYERSFFDSRSFFIDIAADLKELEVDAIVIATETVGSAVRLVRDLHSIGVGGLLIGTGALWSNEFVSATQKSGEGIVIPTPYNIFSRNAENIRFVEGFRNRFGRNPDAVAAQAYDSLQLLAHVMRNEVSATTPEMVSIGLRYMQEKHFAVGEYEFELSGELVRNITYFNQISNGEFIMFKDARAELMHTPLNFYMLDGRLIMRPTKPSDRSGE